MSLTSPIFLSSAPITSVPLNLDARYWSCRCELMNFAELADADAALVVEDDEDGCVISVDLAAGALVVEIDEDGCVISVDLAAGALVVEVDEGGCVISVDLEAGALVVEVDEGGCVIS